MMDVTENVRMDAAAASAGDNSDVDNSNYQQLSTVTNDQQPTYARLNISDENSSRPRPSPRPRPTMWLTANSKQ